jgi:hypothetical protein
VGGRVTVRARLARLVERLARLPRFRTAAIVVLAALPLGAAARTDQAGAGLVSWLLSWALVAFLVSYALLVVCALLARSDPGGGGRGRGPAG